MKKKGIEIYREYLGARYKTFLYALNSFIETKGEVVVELGTSRSFVSSEYEGCMVNDVKYWAPDKPHMWDWGAGLFTMISSIHLHEYSPKVHTVDISFDAISIAMKITESYEQIITYHHMSSKEFLSGFEGKIDLLYMDAGETGEGADLLHLEEARIACSRELFSEAAVVLVDDVNIPGESISKGTYSIPFLCDNGFELKLSDYQVVLQRESW